MYSVFKERIAVNYSREINTTYLAFENLPGTVFFKVFVVENGMVLPQNL